MTKDVLVVVRGMRAMDGQEEEVETSARGTYYRRNGTHFILFEETQEEAGGAVRNLYKIMPGRMEVIKSGEIRTHMVFEAGKRHTAGYLTPMGELAVGACTRKLKVHEEEELLEVCAEYSLSINGEHVSDCRIRVAVRPPEGILPGSSPQ